MLKKVHSQTSPTSPLLTSDPNLQEDRDLFGTTTVQSTDPVPTVQLENPNNSVTAMIKFLCEFNFRVGIAVDQIISVCNKLFVAESKLTSISSGTTKMENMSMKEKAIQISTLNNNIKKARVELCSLMKESAYNVELCKTTPKDIMEKFNNLDERAKEALEKEFIPSLTKKQCLTTRKPIGNSTSQSPSVQERLEHHRPPSISPIDIDDADSDFNKDE